MEAQSPSGFQDPLSAAVEESERASGGSLEEAAVAEASRDSPTPSTNRQAADGSEDTEKATNDGTDSSSAWSPEVRSGAAASAGRVTETDTRRPRL